ncbi:InlB B-repeat-containing protein, partial [uncultured Bacteroides sp.]|uniref:InlB B-repeat-containing protein n=1 Tax=uncultured Bacteroides sp. TaxID=162156 RepID=UPI00262CEAF8
MPAEDKKVYQAKSKNGSQTITYYVEVLAGETGDVTYNGTRYKVYAAYEGMNFGELTEEDQTPIEGYTYSDWKQPDRISYSTYGDAALYYVRNSYIVSFENCTGIADASVKFEASIESARPTADPGRPADIPNDYTFGGWYTSPACEDGTEVAWSTKMPAYNLQVYAKWEAPTYDVSFETNGAGDIPSQTVPKGEQIEQPADPSKEGDKFLGWYIDKACTIPYVENQQITAPLTLYAKWESSDRRSYTVQYVDSEGKLINNPVSDKDGETIANPQPSQTANVRTSVEVEAPSIVGYTAAAPLMTVLIEEENQVINVVYTKHDEWTYKVNYVDIDTNEVLDTAELPTTDNVIMVTYRPFSGYALVGAAQQQINKNGIHEITFQYKKDAAAYTIEYYYDGEKDENATVPGNGEIGQQITEYPDKNKEGFRLEKVENLPLILGSSAEHVIKVYYVGKVHLTYDANGGQNPPVDDTAYDRGTEVTLQGQGAMSYDGRKVVLAGWTIDTPYGPIIPKNGTAPSGMLIPENEDDKVIMNEDHTAFAVWADDENGNNIPDYLENYKVRVTYTYDEGDLKEGDKAPDMPEDYESAPLNVGDSYRIESPAVEGWVAMPLVVSGIIEDSNVTAEVVYHKDINSDKIPDEFQITVTYRVENGSWNNGKKDDIKVVLTLTDDGTPDGNWDINGTAKYPNPEVGDKPATGYTVGSWTDLAPETFTKDHHNKVYVYEYVKDDQQTQKTEYTVKHVVDGVEQTDDTKTYENTAWINEKNPTIAIEDGSLAQKSYTGYKFSS